MRQAASANLAVLDGLEPGLTTLTLSGRFLRQSVRMHLISEDSAVASKAATASVSILWYRLGEEVFEG